MVHKKEAEEKFSTFYLWLIFIMSSGARSSLENGMAVVVVVKLCG